VTATRSQFDQLVIRYHVCYLFIFFFGKTFLFLFFSPTPTKIKAPPAIACKKPAAPKYWHDLLGLSEGQAAVDIVVIKPVPSRIPPSTKNGVASEYPDTMESLLLYPVLFCVVESNFSSNFWSVNDLELEDALIIGFRDELHDNGAMNEMIIENRQNPETIVAPLQGE